MIQNRTRSIPFVFAFVCAAIGALLPCVRAAQETAAMTIQLTTEVDGRPYTGVGGIKIAVVDPSGNALWSNDGTLTGEPAAAIPVPQREAGKPFFTVALGDQALKMPPLDMSGLPANAEVRVWFAAEGRSFEELTPRLRLSTVPYSGQAQHARDAAMLNGQTSSAFARAPFQGESGSGLPTGYRLKVAVDKNEDGTMLAGPGVDAEVEVVEYKDGSDPITHRRPGKVKYKNITLKRGLVNDSSLLDWYAWARDAAQGHPVERSVTLTLVDGDNTPIIRGSALRCIPVSHGLFLADNGEPMEQITLAWDAFEWQILTPPQGGKPPLNLQRGNTPVRPATGPSTGGTLLLQMDGAVLPLVSISGKKGYDYYRSGAPAEPDIVLSQNLGNGSTNSGQILTLRANPTGTPLFLNMFQKVLAGQVERKSGSIIYLDREGHEVMRYNFFEAWPCRWKAPELNSHSDTHIVEEIEFVVERVERG